jgi:hypothetical protein
MKRANLPPTNGPISACLIMLGKSFLPSIIFAYSQTKFLLQSAKKNRDVLLIVPKINQ